MPIEPPAPTFPGRESLLRFFSLPAQASVAVEEVAELLGIAVDIFREVLRAEESEPVDGTILWTEAAGYLLDAWPRADILDALGAEASALLPSQFQLVSVTWSLPIFLVRAIEHQAMTIWTSTARLPGRSVTGGPSSRHVQDYVSDVLFNEIQPETVRALEHDSGFAAAYRYPAID